MHVLLINHAMSQLVTGCYATIEKPPYEII